MMWKRTLTALLAVTLIVPAASLKPSEARASGAAVSVHIPAFTVTVDGQPIYSAKLTYPLLVYKDITYFPMTWNFGQGMGLRILWTAEQGLRIDAMTEYKTELAMEAGGSFRTDLSYSARVVDFPVTVGGRPIDNALETYPLLEFEDITYFPMTWEFAHGMFRWDTEWSDEYGFSIRTAPRVYFNSILYDDEQYLYAPTFGSGDMLQIRKDLQGMPMPLGKEKTKEIWDLREERNKTQVPEPVELEGKDDKLFYQGVELLSMTPFYEKNNKYYDANPSQPRNEKRTFINARAIKLDDKTALVSVKIFYATFIPGPYTPHEQQSFLVRDGKATALNDFTQWIIGYLKADGGTWIWSDSPDYIRASNSGTLGQVMWVGSDGQTKLMNDAMNAQYIQMLHPYDNEAIVKAYRLFGEEENPVEGFYRIRSDCTFAKIAELTGHERQISLLQPPIPYGYADAQGNLYVLTANGITSYNGDGHPAEGQSRIWTDSELWNAMGRPDPYAPRQ